MVRSKQVRHDLTITIGTPRRTLYIKCIGGSRTFGHDVLRRARWFILEFNSHHSTVIAIRTIRARLAELNLTRADYFYYND